MPVNKIKINAGKSEFRVVNSCLSRTKLKSNAEPMVNKNEIVIPKNESGENKFKTNPYPGSAKSELKFKSVFALKSDGSQSAIPSMINATY